MGMQILRYAAFAEESTPVETPTPEPVFAIDQTKSSLDSGVDTEIAYPGSLGRGVRLHRPGFYSCKGDIEYGFDLRSIGWLLKWALGGYVCTAGAGNYLHEIYGSALTFLPTFAAYLGKDMHDGESDFCHVFHGCGIDAIELSIAEEFTTAKVSIVASKDSRGTFLSRSEVELLLPGATEYPLAFHEVTLSLDGSDISAKVKELTLSFNNNMDITGGRSIGSRYARRLPANERASELSMTVYYDSLDMVELLWGNAEGPDADGTTEAAIVINFDGGGTDSMEIVIPRYVITAASLQPSGKDEMEHGIAGTCYADDVLLNDDATTVFTELLVNLTNEQAEMTAEVGT